MSRMVFHGAIHKFGIDPQEGILKTRVFQVSNYRVKEPEEAVEIHQILKACRESYRLKNRCLVMEFHFGKGKDLILGFLF